MKIAIIGLGKIGGELLCQINSNSLCEEVVLCCRKQETADAWKEERRQAHALNSAKKMIITATTDYQDMKDIDLAIITAGEAVKPGQDRLDLADVNARTTVDIAKDLYNVAPNAKIIVVTNPVDICTYFIIKETGYSETQVLKLWMFRGLGSSAIGA